MVSLGLQVPGGREAGRGTIPAHIGKQMFKMFIWGLERHALDLGSGDGRSSQQEKQLMCYSTLLKPEESHPAPIRATASS